MVDQAEQSRDKYRSNYDRISWTNSVRPKYQGGTRPVYGTPKNVIDVTPPNQSILPKDK